MYFQHKLIYLGDAMMCSWYNWRSPMCSFVGI